MANKLYVCGDSWTDWPLPPKPYHWIDYLEHHYDVIRLGQRACSNYDIFSQIGKIPLYETGDRVLVIWTSPSRIQLMYDITEIKLQDENQSGKRWWHRVKLSEDVTFHNAYEVFRSKRLEVYQDDKNNIFDGEIAFMKKIKDVMLKEFNPIFLTWDEILWSRTNHFMDLISVSTLHDEYPRGENKNDYHPGKKGCYELYKYVIKQLLNPKDSEILAPRTDLI